MAEDKQADVYAEIGQCGKYGEWVHPVYGKGVPPGKPGQILLLGADGSRKWVDPPPDELARVRAVALELLEEYVGEKFALDSQFNSVRLGDYDRLKAEWKARILGETK